MNDNPHPTIFIWDVRDQNILNDILGIVVGKFQQVWQYACKVFFFFFQKFLYHIFSYESVTSQYLGFFLWPKLLNIILLYLLITSETPPSTSWDIHRLTQKSFVHNYPKSIIFRVWWVVSLFWPGSALSSLMMYLGGSQMLLVGRVKFTN